jgi:hypothetical protein
MNKIIVKLSSLQTFDRD